MSQLFSQPIHTHSTMPGWPAWLPNQRSGRRPWRTLPSQENLQGATELQSVRGRATSRSRPTSTGQRAASAPRPGSAARSTSSSTRRPSNVTEQPPRQPEMVYPGRQFPAAVPRSSSQLGNNRLPTQTRPGNNAHSRNRCTCGSPVDRSCWLQSCATMTAVAVLTILCIDCGGRL